VPQVVWGHYAAASEGNDLILYRDDTRTTEITRFTFPRQRVSPFLCIADFFRSVESADLDYASFMLVTMGPEFPSDVRNSSRTTTTPTTSCSTASASRC